MRPVTINPSDPVSALNEVMRASHENDLAEIAQSFSISGSYTSTQTLTVPSAVTPVSPGSPVSPTTTSVSLNPAIVLQAHMSANQTVTPGTWTTMAVDTIDVDVQSAFNTSTHRWTPNVAGLYLVQITAQPNAVSSTGGVTIMKDGPVGTGAVEAWAVSNGLASATVLGLVSMNGTTDFIEIDVISDRSTVIADNPGLIITQFQTDALSKIATAITNLNTDVTNLATAVNSLITALSSLNTNMTSVDGSLVNVDAFLATLISTMQKGGINRTT